MHIDENGKEYVKCNDFIMATNDYKKIIRIIRHKTNKKIYRIINDRGVIDVTEDHSLLDN